MTLEFHCLGVDVIVFRRADELGVIRREFGFLFFESNGVVQLRNHELLEISKYIEGLME